MSVKVFKTRDDYGNSVEIIGVGLLMPNGSSAIPVERAARYMTELQDASGNPLDGGDLSEAAKRFADARGLVVADVAKSALSGPDRDLHLANPADAAIADAAEAVVVDADEVVEESEAAAEAAEKAANEPPTAESAPPAEVEKPKKGGNK